MESPVAVRVEFDPPVITVGSRSIYRIVLNALDESVRKLPDALPSPKGLLDFSPGARAQNYVPVGAQKLQPQTTTQLPRDRRRHRKFPPCPRSP